MERLAAKMGGSVKFPFNNSECLDADYFKVCLKLFLDYNNLYSCKQKGDRLLVTFTFICEYGRQMELKCC